MKSLDPLNAKKKHSQERKMDLAVQFQVITFILDNKPQGKWGPGRVFRDIRILAKKLEG